MIIISKHTTYSTLNIFIRKKINVTGTVRKTRKGIPTLLAKLKVGQIESQHTKNILVVKWRDRRDVLIFMLTILSLKTKWYMLEKNDHQGNAILKPVAVMHYNESIGPIDKTDMLLSSVE